MEKGSLQIHSENILPIIKKWLYSDKDIFIRELVSNACDAIHKAKVLRDQGEVQATDEEFRIDIDINKEARTLKFTDNGIGMDAEEIKKYIAQIAFSGAEEFLSKYKTNNERDQIIGHFGLGFYSAYMVADKVEINTLSYKSGAISAFWSCDGSSEYELGTGTRSTRGTEITLFIGKDHDECLDASHVRQILNHYCSFLPYPIYLNGQHINTQVPLWIKAPSECTPQDYLEFYRHLYPMEEEPLFWVHLNVDYPFHLKGILYFPKIKRDFDLNKNAIQLYCNRVFVSDNCKDLIPNYLMVLKGVIDSPDIPLNVSRSYLQMDKTVRQLGSHVSKKVSDSLSTLYKTDREKFIKSWQDVSTIVKLGALEDEKFYERVKDFLIWQNTDKDWTTVAEYLERNRDKTKDKVFYTVDEKHAAHFLDSYRQKGIEVLCANSPIDPYVMQYLEGKLAPVTFQRIDAEVHDDLLDKSREKTILDAEGRTEASKLAEFIKQQLDDEGIEVEAKSLANDAVPGIVMMDEKQRRMRDYFLRMDPEQGAQQMKLFGKRTFVVNTNNVLITAIQKMGLSNPTLAKELTKQVYDLALLSQKEMAPADLHEFVQRSNRVLEALAKQAAQ
jgi:molecular chaperone HtpG